MQVPSNRFGVARCARRFRARKASRSIVRSRLLVAAAAALLLAPEHGDADVFEWSGNSPVVVGNNNWSDPRNWAGNVAPDNDGTAEIQIGQSLRLNPVVDLAWNIDTLEFQDSGPFSLSGQPLTLQGDLTNASTGTATINNTLVVANDATWRATDGPLVFNGAITGSTPNFFLQAPQPITFGGAATNSFSDEIKLQEGTLILSKSSANRAVTSDLAIGGVAGKSAVVRWDASDQISEADGVALSVRALGEADLNGKLETLDELIVTGGSVHSFGGRLTVLSRITMGGGEIDMGIGQLLTPPLIVNSAAAAQGTFDANLLRLAQPRTTFQTNEVSVDVEMVIKATISDHESGPSELRKVGPGVLRLTTDGTYSGGTVVEGGTLRVDNTAGSATGTGSVTVFSTGRLDGNGAMSGQVIVSNGALLAPGATLGSLDVGSLVLGSGSRAQFQLDLSQPVVKHDSVAVTGNANFEGGDLELQFLNFSFPMAGQSFSLLSASSITGAFANVASGQRLNTLEGGGSFLVQYGPGSSFNPNEIVISDFLPATVDLPGDYNEDGEVNAADYVTWRMHAGTAFDLQNRNPLLAGNIGPADYQFWIDNFGAVAGTGSISTATVPEPACVIAWSLAIIGLLRPSRKVATDL